MGICTRMPLFSFFKRASRTYGGANRRIHFERRSVFNKRNAIVVLLVVGIGLIVGTGIVVWASQGLPDPNRLTDSQAIQSTKIYDRTGQHLLYEVYQNQKRTIVDLDHVSAWVSKATIAIEDKDFYNHKGIRITSIIRAGLNDLIGRRTGSGGASTLTQQLVKNAVLGNEHSLLRKIKEAILALRLEREYSKDEILKMYLNDIPYGSTNYGIESAAQSYFHKSAQDLSLPEAATLAALVKAPSRYLNNRTALRDRRDTVLQLMFEQGYITADQKVSAEAEPLAISGDKGIVSAPHFVLYVKQLLADRFGEKLVDTGGLKVITTLDYDKQQLAEKIVKEQGDKLAKRSNANNAALVAVDPRSGQILAMVGSRDFNNQQIDGQFNIVTQGKLQPGSSFKPFVYTAAFEKGYTPDTVLYDATTDFDLRQNGQKYTPQNFDGKEHGLVTLRTALQGSLNIPAVKTMYLVGYQNTIDFAKRFGYTTLTGDYGLSLVLGGGEVNLLEHTNAYATLADNGVFHPSVSILSVQDPAGNSLYQWTDTPGAAAVKPELVALTTSVLTDNQARAFMFGLHSNLVLPDRPVAAKTGTTQNDRDAWTLGYTPSLAAGVWVGNTPRHISMKGGGNLLAGVIWNQFMRLALQGTPPETFPSPPPNTATKPVLRGNDGGITLAINSMTGRIATSSTPPNLTVQRSFLPPHDILYYVQKDDPNGPPPANPDDDPQFQNWENALQSWMTRQQQAGQQLTFTEPPALYDNPQSADLTPTLTVVSPTPNQIITSRALTITAQASAPRGVAEVLYFIDGASIGAIRQPPFTLSYYAQTLPRGNHDLRVIAEDDLGDSAQQDISFDLEADLDPPSAAWFDGSALTLAGDDFPRVMNLTPFRWSDAKDVKIYLHDASGDRLIYTFIQGQDNLFNGQLSFTWNHSPGAGGYVLKAITADGAGKALEKDLNITVK